MSSSCVSGFLMSVPDISLHRAFCVFAWYLRLSERNSLLSYVGCLFGRNVGLIQIWTLIKSFWILVVACFCFFLVNSIYLGSVSEVELTWERCLDGVDQVVPRGRGNRGNRALSLWR